MTDWGDKYDHVPESNGTFCSDCGRYCKKKTKVGYKQKDMYIVYKLRVSDNNVLHWEEIKRVCPECKNKVHVNERTLIRKITDNSPLPEYNVMEAKCIRCRQKIFIVLRRGSSRSCDVIPLCRKCQEKYLVDDIKENKE